MLKKISFLSLFLFTLPLCNAFAATDVEQDEVTIAEPFHVNQWLRNDTSFEPVMFGEWKLNAEESLRIHPLPLASNTCLIELDSRMVPGFLFEVHGSRYVVVGEQVSGTMELMPRIFAYQLSDDLHTLEVELIAVTTDGGILNDPEAFFKMLKDTKQRSGVEEQKREFQRI